MILLNKKQLNEHKVKRLKIISKLDWPKIHSLTKNIKKNQKVKKKDFQKKLKKSSFNTPRQPTTQPKLNQKLKRKKQKKLKMYSDIINKTTTHEEFEKSSTKSRNNSTLIQDPSKVKLSKRSYLKKQRPNILKVRTARCSQQNSPTRTRISHQKSNKISPMRE